MMASVDHKKKLEVSQMPPAYAQRLLKNDATDIQKAMAVPPWADPLSCRITWATKATMLMPIDPNSR